MATNTLSYNPNAPIGSPSLTGGMTMPTFDFNRRNVFGDTSGAGGVQARMDETMAAFERSQRESEAAARDAMVQSQRALNMALVQISQAPEINFDQRISEYQAASEEAVGRIAFGVEKNAEFMSLQIEAAARTGRLGANAFAIGREAARKTGMILADTFKAIGDYQMQAATQVASLRVAETEMQQHDRHGRMNAMVSLAGAQIEASMKYAGLMAGLASDRGKMLGTLAQLSTDLVVRRESNAIANRQIDAKLAIARMDSQSRTNITGMQIAENRRQFDTRMAMGQEAMEAVFADTES